MLPRTGLAGRPAAPSGSGPAPRGRHAHASVRRVRLPHAGAAGTV